MKLKALVSKKVVTLALAGSIGLGALGTATYAAAPGMIDKVVGAYATWTSDRLEAYKKEQSATITSRLWQEFYTIRDSFAKKHDAKVEEAKKKVDADVNAYIKEKSNVTEEERLQIENRIVQDVDKKRDQVTNDLKKQVDDTLTKEFPSAK